MVRKASPISAPASSIQRSAVRPRGSSASSARTTAYAARVISSTSIASGLSKRNISAATGVRASSAPATRPAYAPAHRFTVAYVAATAPTPIRACGSSSENEPNPRTRAKSTITHSDAGGLSTVIELPASSEPNSHAFSDTVPDFTAAA